MNLVGNKKMKFSEMSWLSGMVYSTPVEGEIKYKDAEFV